jgi:transporter family-2 protein
MSFLLYPFAILAGALNAVQAGSNATLAKTLGQPVAAALVIAAVATTTYLATIPFLGLSWPGQERIAQVPWWAWSGGVLGAFYILSTLFVAEKVGSATYIGLTVTAAIVASVILDHFGLVGFEVREAGFGRIAGAGLMVVGIVLVCVF